MHENTMDNTDRNGLPGEVLEEVFLSPRVVDAALLSEFAESLREMLEGAAAEREQLRAAVTAGESVAETLNQTAAKAGEKLRPAVKLLPTIDQKLAQAEAALARADEAAQRAEATAGQAAKTEAEEAARAAVREANEEGAAVLREAQAAFEATLERTRQLEGRLGQLTQRAELAIEALETECKGRLDNATRHAQDVLGTMVAEVDARAEEAIARLTALVEDRRAAAEAAVGESIEIGTPADGNTPEGTPAETGATSAEAMAAAREAHADIETLIAAIKARTLRMADELEAHADEAARRVAGATEQARTTERMATTAEKRLAVAQDQLRLIDERGREIAAGASQALVAFDEELASRMHAVREMMEQLAAMTDRNAPAVAEQEPDALGKTQTAEVKPGGEGTKASDEPKGPVGEPKGFVRIDRPVEGNAVDGRDATEGPLGRLRF